MLYFLKILSQRNSILWAAPKDERSRNNEPAEGSQEFMSETGILFFTKRKIITYFDYYNLGNKLSHNAAEVAVNDVQDASATPDVTITSTIPSNPNFTLSSSSGPQLVQPDNTRATMLKTRYGHVHPGSQHQNLLQYYLHFKVDNRAVNQGLCFFNAELNTYYMRSRKDNIPGQTPKELIIMDLERSSMHQGHTHISFYVTGKTKEF